MSIGGGSVSSSPRGGNVEGFDNYYCGSCNSIIQTPIGKGAPRCPNQGCSYLERGFGPYAIAYDLRKKYGDVGILTTQEN